MTSHGARTGRRTLASTSCLLLLTGLSCKYNVTLPWVPEDASARTTDSPLDQWSSSSPDVLVSGSDARGCQGYSKEWSLERVPTPMIVAIDRSASMQNSFDSTTKMQAASSALDSLVDGHPGITFSSIWFPWTGCGGAQCCASPVFSMTASKKGLPDAGGCGPYDAGCLPPSNDSPFYQALYQARTFIGKDYWGRLSPTLVFITDKNPSCASESPSESCESAANEAAKLGDMGARVFVLVPNADGQTPNCVTWIASKNAHFFSDAQQLMTAKSARELRDDLDRIADEIEEKPCRFYLVGVVDDPGSIERIEIAGTPIPREETGKSGWKIVYGGAIQFSPDLCRTIARSPSTAVKAFTCRSGGTGGSYGN